MGQREQEAAAMTIAEFAADIDGVLFRADRHLRRLETLDALPNEVVAVRRAMEGLSDVARKLRQDGFLSSRQQKLL